MLSGSVLFDIPWESIALDREDRGASLLRVLLPYQFWEPVSWSDTTILLILQGLLDHVRWPQVCHGEPRGAISAHAAQITWVPKALSGTVPCLLVPSSYPLFLVCLDKGLRDLRLGTRLALEWILNIWSPLLMISATVGETTFELLVYQSPSRILKIFIPMEMRLELQKTFVYRVFSDKRYVC